MKRQTAKDKIRAALKVGFFAGFKAAQSVNVFGAWEECRERWALDYPKREPKDAAAPPSVRKDHP